MAMGEDNSQFESNNELRLSDYGNILIDHKWMIVGLVAAALFLSLMYVSFATPVYRANLLLQVEDAAPDSKNFLNETTGLFDVKTYAVGELQVIGSRMVLSAAAEQAGLEIDARPKYLPIVGKWLARKAETLSEPGFLGIGGYVTGNEKIEVSKFTVPALFEDGAPFTLTLGEDNNFTLTHDLLDTPINGVLGQVLRATIPEGDIELKIDRLTGKPGAEYVISKASELRIVEQLQGRLQLAEQGRQSNVISVALDDTDRGRLILTLNAIAEQYVRQNTQRKSAEAEKTLAFLDTQLPVFQRQLKDSEDAYAQFRNQNGTIAFEEEAKILLKRTSDLQTALLDLQQRGREADVSFTDQSTKQQTLTKQKSAIQAELNSVNARIAAMPNIQRDALRLERAVTVNSGLYQSMMNNASQMRLVKEGKVGNVRLLDKAVMSKDPVKPQKGLVVAFAFVVSLLIGPGIAILRTRLRSGFHDPKDLQSKTGLEVFAVVPQSPHQVTLDQRIAKGTTHNYLLADAYPSSQPVEALRNLRAALKVALARAPNNRILITGATPGIGKSFIASNFARLLSQSGKRVLLINADLRKRDSNKIFGLEQRSGLSHVLSGETTYEHAINPSVRPNLDVMTTGTLPVFPTELLESPAFSSMLNRVSPLYDHVVIDTAPVLVAADALAVAPLCGVVLLVARADHSELDEVDECIRRFAQSEVVLNGVLFNGMNLNRRTNGSRGVYRYSQYQTESEAATI